MFLWSGRTCGVPEEASERHTVLEKRLLSPLSCHRPALQTIGRGAYMWSSQRFGARGGDVRRPRAPKRSRWQDIGRMATVWSAPPHEDRPSGILRDALGPRSCPRRRTEGSRNGGAGSARPPARGGPADVAVACHRSDAGPREPPRPPWGSRNECSFEDQCRQQAYCRFWRRNRCYVNSGDLCRSSRNHGCRARPFGRSAFYQDLVRIWGVPATRRRVPPR